MSIEQAEEILVKKYLFSGKYPDVFGMGIFGCENCGGKYIEISMNTHNKKLMAEIPNELYGFRISKVHQSEENKAQFQGETETVINPPIYSYPALMYPYSRHYPRPIHAPRVVFYARR